jgi:hypothetical protein
MNEAEIIRMFREFYEGLFPKVCPNCGRRYETLRDYIVASQRLWPSLNYDMELGADKAPRPIGGLAMANCLCGSTLALSTRSMPVPQTHLMVAWIRTEMERRGLKQAELLDHLRDEVRKQVLAELTPEVAPGTREAACGQPPHPAPVSGAPAAGPLLGDRPPPLPRPKDCAALRHRH